MAINIVNVTIDVMKALADSGATPPNASATALGKGIAQAIVNALQSADVDPTGGTPPMSNSGGPVAGLGKLK